ncbi:hypothetical protein JR316_0008078 [Psilocybe cubensis]|uniref:Uncharacterized protein n=2 Tax=Psilocybe cubensis TaxID=181762 RepID=A0ACB8GV58_PSICU|nr:hypothetical protein JR316_0008078 [Psilocybe cubensis]KAH9479484.1 hypothetical protein JR316_0008078 [Psilocybe cubensis]
MLSSQSGSRRWTHFHSALILAVQRSAHKWTFEDFAECFPLFVESDRNGSSATYNSISEYIETQNLRDLDKLFTDYNVKEKIDVLHKVVIEAKDRKEKGDLGKDIWKEDLDPRVAVCARTVPVLKSEAARLRKLIAEIEEENRELEAELQEKVKATDDANEQVLKTLDKLDLILQEWKSLPQEEIEAWTAQTVESLSPKLRS